MKMLIIKNLESGREVKISEYAIKTIIALISQKPFRDMKMSMKLITVK